MNKTEVMSISIPIDLRKQLKERAKKEGRPVSNLITVLLTKAVKEKAASTL